MDTGHCDPFYTSPPAPNTSRLDVQLGPSPVTALGVVLWFANHQPSYIGNYYSYKLEFLCPSLDGTTEGSV